MGGNGIEGAWRLASFRIERSSGDDREPLGSDPLGLLVYGPGKAMAVQIMRRDRPSFVARDPQRGSPEEAEAAFRGYLAYAGTYELDDEDGSVVHRIELSWFPNWVGTEQKRYYRLEGDLLELRTPAIAYAGGTSVGVLHWRRTP